MEFDQFEEWRDVPGYEGEYQASSQGRLRSLDRDLVTNNQYKDKGFLVEEQRDGRGGRDDESRGGDKSRFASVYRVSLPADRQSLTIASLEDPGRNRRDHRSIRIDHRSLVIRPQVKLTTNHRSPATPHQFLDQIQMQITHHQTKVTSLGPCAKCEPICEKCVPF